MAEAFVKTFKRDYVHVNPIPDECTTLLRIDHWMENYNSEHPHSRPATVRRGSTLRHSNQKSVQSNGVNSSLPPNAQHLSKIRV